ncbi:MAG: hypothetical protein ACU837_02455 [Gammaproteobacteria bacterium]
MRKLWLTAFLLATNAAAQATPDIKEGMWEISALVQVPDLSPEQIPQMTQHECLTREKLIPEQQQQIKILAVKTASQSFRSTRIFRENRARYAKGACFGMQRNVSG